VALRGQSNSADEGLAVLGRLEHWELRIQQILAMYIGDGTIPSAVCGEARTTYWTLKMDLRAAVKIGESDEGYAQMTETERRFLYPALSAASAHLAARVDARPQEWYQSLCDAVSDISSAIVQLTDARNRGQA